MSGRLKSSRLSFIGKMCEVWRIVEFLLLITLCEMVFLDMLWILRALLGRKRKEIYVLFDKNFLCIMLFFCLRQFLAAPHFWVDSPNKSVPGYSTSSFTN